MSSTDTSIEVSMKPFQDYYEAKEWLQAKEWLETNKSQLGEGLFYFNMGVVSIKLDQLPVARYYFEQANLKNFNDPWVYKNIESIRSDLGLQLVETKTFFEEVKTKVLTYLSSEHLVTMIFIIFLSTLLYWWKFKIRKNFYILTSILMTIIIFGFFVFTKMDTLNLANQNQAIVLEQMGIYEGPSAIFEELGKLPPGLKVTWGENNHGWAKIVHPVSFQGWVQFDEKHLRVLK